MWQPKYLTQKELEALWDKDEDVIIDNMAIDSECDGNLDAKNDLPDTMSRKSIPMSLRQNGISYLQLFQKMIHLKCITRI